MFEVVVELTGIAVASGFFGASFSPNVEATTVVITGITEGMIGVSVSFS